MADAKISQLTSLSNSAVAQDDLLAIVDVSVNETKKITKGAFLWKDPPLTSTSPGTAGDLAYDSNHIYICIATNTWRRTNAHNSW